LKVLKINSSQKIFSIKLQVVRGFLCVVKKVKDDKNKVQVAFFQNIIDKKQLAAHLQEKMEWLLQGHQNGN
jgi:hypothetical protein